MQTLDVSSRTDRGRRRRQNEDAILVRSKKDPLGKLGSIYLLAVADGMGGAAGGRVASAEAVRVLAEEFERYAGGDPGEFLGETFNKANASVRRLAQQGPNLQGMCTTLVAAVIAGERAWVANVGDSRAYLVRAGQIQRLTEDHSLVAEQVRAGQMTEDEAAVSPHRNIITRCVGSEETISVDLFPPLTLRTNDSLLLCSDGLSGVVSDDEIATTCSNVSPKEAANQLVDLANDRGGPDNISVVIGRSYDAMAETVALRGASRFGLGGPAMVLFAILIAVLLAGGLIAGVVLLAGQGDGGSLALVVSSPTAQATPAMGSPTPVLQATQTLTATVPALELFRCRPPALKDAKCIEVEFTGTLFGTAEVVRRALDAGQVPLNTIMKYLWLYNDNIRGSGSVHSIGAEGPVGKVQFPLPPPGQPLGENPPEWSSSKEAEWENWLGEAQDGTTPSLTASPRPTASAAATHSPTPLATEGSGSASPSIVATATPVAEQ